MSAQRSLNTDSNSVLEGGEKRVRDGLSAGHDDVASTAR